MKRNIASIAAVLVLAGTAFCLEAPEPELLLRFFRERLTPDGLWFAESFCEVVVLGETLNCEGVDTLGPECAATGPDCAEGLSLFALRKEFLALPLELARSDFDSLAVKKSRKTIEGELCWRLRLFDGDNRWEIYLSADRFFRVKLIELKIPGRNRPDNRWRLEEVRRGKDLPVEAVRVADFQWDEESKIVSRRRLINPRRVSTGNEP